MKEKEMSPDNAFERELRET